MSRYSRKREGDNYIPKKDLVDKINRDKKELIKVLDVPGSEIYKYFKDVVKLHDIKTTFKRTMFATTQWSVDRLRKEVLATEEFVRIAKDDKRRNYFEKFGLEVPEEVFQGLDLGGLILWMEKELKRRNFTHMMIITYRLGFFSGYENKQYPFDYDDSDYFNFQFYHLYKDKLLGKILGLPHSQLTGAQWQSVKEFRAFTKQDLEDVKRHKKEWIWTTKTKVLRGSEKH